MTEPTDAEIRGLAATGNGAAQADGVQEDAALSAIDEVLALFPFDATAQAFSIEGGPELKADGDTHFYSRNKVLTFLTKITTILVAARAAQKEGEKT